MGLNDKIKSATSTTEVENLLVEGTAFSNASLKTRRRWKSVAVRRLKQLKGEVDTKPVAEVPEAEPRNKYRQKRFNKP